MLKAKIQRKNKFVLKRQKLGKLDDNDMIISTAKEWSKKSKPERMTVAAVA